jgi:hypothetical protein
MARKHYLSPSSMVNLCLFSSLIAQLFVIKYTNSGAPMAYACNPNFSWGRNQLDHNSKAAWAHSSWDLILQKAHHKMGLQSGSRCSPKFKPQYHTHTHTHKQKQKKIFIIPNEI